MLQKKNERSDNGTANNDQEYDWTQDYMILGTDVRSLFPSLSAQKTGEAVRQQFKKSKVKWENVDWRLITMYVKLQENYWKNNELNGVKLFLPTRKSNIGRPPSIGTDKVEERFKWPYTIDHLTDGIKAELMGLVMEVAVAFFFTNFAYTFGGEAYRQNGGGPIGARLTMAVARLVMQSWKDKYDIVLNKSNIEELLSGLYVDDGRSFHRKLQLGEHFDEKLGYIIHSKEAETKDIAEGISREELTRREILAAMNSINEDLSFTMELHTDFNDENERTQT